SPNNRRGRPVPLRGPRPRHPSGRTASGRRAGTSCSLPRCTARPPASAKARTAPGRPRLAPARATPRWQQGRIPRLRAGGGQQETNREERTSWRLQGYTLVAAAPRALQRAQGRLLVLGAQPLFAQALLAQPVVVGQLLLVALLGLGL